MYERFIIFVKVSMQHKSVYTLHINKYTYLRNILLILQTFILQINALTYFLRKQILLMQTIHEY